MEASKGHTFNPDRDAWSTPAAALNPEEEEYDSLSGSDDSLDEFDARLHTQTRRGVKPSSLGVLSRSNQRGPVSPWKAKAFSSAFKNSGIQRRRAASPVPVPTRASPRSPERSPRSPTPLDEEQGDRNRRTLQATGADNEGSAHVVKSPRQRFQELLLERPANEARSLYAPRNETESEEKGQKGEQARKRSTLAERRNRFQLLSQEHPFGHASREKPKANLSKTEEVRRYRDSAVQRRDPRDAVRVVHPSSPSP